jgi:hypothetical protein
VVRLFRHGGNGLKFQNNLLLMLPLPPLLQFTRLAWTLTEGVHIGVGIYNLIATAKKPIEKKVAADTKLPVQVGDYTFL